MTITITETIEKTREIHIPSFYRLSENDVIAFVDEQNIINAYRGGDYSLISSKTKEFFTDWKKLTDENIITEEQFFEVFNEVHNSLSFKAELIEKKTPGISIDNINDYEAQENLKQAINY